MSPLLSCYYNYDTQILVVTYPVAADTPAGTVLTFTFDSFINPYSGVPRTGFTITTNDPVGG